MAKDFEHKYVDSTHHVHKLLTRPVREKGAFPDEISYSLLSEVEEILSTYLASDTNNNLPACVHLN